MKDKNIRSSGNTKKLLGIIFNNKFYFADFTS